jgi:tRNA pseudouridine55 synthase
MVQGFLSLNKPTGMTSHDCVGRVRRLLGIKRVGHGGTLDPLATGVLPIALGSATRLLQFLPADKVYRATIRLGITTTTDDLAGEVLAKRPISELNFESVKLGLQQFQGPIQQVPPDYSAIQIQGQRLYDLARQGKVVEVQSRLVEIHQLEILAWRPGAFPEIDLAIACGPGTYIRAIARDLGASLKTGGTLAALTRTASNGFNLLDSLSFKALEAQVENQIFIPIPPADALGHLPLIKLSAEIAQRWSYGQKIALSPDQVSSSEILRVHHEEGHFLGIAQQVESILVPKVVLQ